MPLRFGLRVAETAGNARSESFRPSRIEGSCISVGEGFARGDDAGQRSMAIGIINYWFLFIVGEGLFDLAIRVATPSVTASTDRASPIRVQPQRWWADISVVVVVELRGSGWVAGSSAWIEM